MTLRAVVVDDEPLARARLCRLLAPQVAVVAECGDGHAAIAAVGEHRPDLLFLDVQMPELDGFGVLAALGPEAVPAIVFVTAFDHYAVRAFDAYAADYLLKPFDEARLRRAVGRAAARAAERGEADRLRALLEGIRAASRPAPPGDNQAAAHPDLPDDDQAAPYPAPPDGARPAPRPGPPDGARPPSRLALPDGARTVFVDVGAVDYVEAEGNYVSVRAGDKSYLRRDTLTSLAERLDMTQFLRVHRSRIVRVDRIRSVEPLAHGEYLLTLTSGVQLTSSRRYRDALRDALGLARSGG